MPLTSAAAQSRRFHLLIGLLAAAAHVPFVARILAEAGETRPWPEGPIVTIQLLICGWFMAAVWNLLTWAGFGAGMVIPLLAYVAARLRLAPARACAIVILIWTIAASLSLGWLEARSGWAMVAGRYMPLNWGTTIICKRVARGLGGASVSLLLLALLLKRAVDRGRHRELPPIRTEGFLPATGIALIASAVSCVLLTNGVWDVCDALTDWPISWHRNGWVIIVLILSVVRTFGWATILTTLGWRTLRRGRRPVYGALWLLIGQVCVAALTLVEERLYTSMSLWLLLDNRMWDGFPKLLIDSTVTAPLSLVIAWCWFRHGPAWEAAAGGVALCESCGYNLTGNVSGRCPECGTAINAMAQMDGRDRV